MIFTPLHCACRALAKKPLPYQPSGLKKEADLVAMGTRTDVTEINHMLRAAGTGIDAPSFGGEFGPHLTLS